MRTWFNTKMYFQLVVAHAVQGWKDIFYFTVIIIWKELLNIPYNPFEKYLCCFREWSLEWLMIMSFCKLQLYSHFECKKNTMVVITNIRILWMEICLRKTVMLLQMPFLFHFFILLFSVLALQTYTAQQNPKWSIR